MTNKNFLYWLFCYCWVELG